MENKASSLVKLAGSRAELISGDLIYTTSMAGVEVKIRLRTWLVYAGNVTPWLILN